MFQMELKK